MKYHVNVNRHRSMADTLILFQGCETSPTREDNRIYIHTGDAATIAAQITRLASPARPEITTLCGSTRFSEAFSRANLYETLEEHIVLSIGCDFKSDDALGLDEEDKARLDRLHLHKVEMADTVLILNVGDYLGSSTRNELRHAITHRKRILFLGSHGCEPGCPCLDADYMEGQPFPVVRWGSDAYFDLCNEVQNHNTAYGQPVSDIQYHVLTNETGESNGLITCRATFATGATQTFCFDVRPRDERLAPRLDAGETR